MCHPHASFAPGLASLNLGIPEGVIARIVERLDTDGNGKLDFQEFTAAFQKPNHLGSTNHRSEPINNNHGSAESFVTTALDEAKCVLSDVTVTNETCRSPLGELISE